MKNEILVINETNGFAPGKEQNRWNNLLSEKHGFNVREISYAGISNDEICYKLIEEIEKDPPKFVIIQWSHYDMHSEFFGEGNVDDHTGIWRGAAHGIFSDNPEVQKFAELHHKLFNNRYMKLKRLLLRIIGFTAYLEQKGVDYVYIKGFESDMYHYRNIQYTPETGFTNVAPRMELQLDFANRPDDYILEKLDIIKGLIDKVGTFKWVDFWSSTWHKEKVDMAEDGRSPGKLANQKMFDDLTKYLEGRNLLEQLK